MAFINKQQPANPQPPVGEKKPAAAPTPEAKPKSKPARSKSPSPWPWGRFTRLLLSVAIVVHLTAVFSAPWHIQLRPTVVPMVEPKPTVPPALDKLPGERFVSRVGIQSQNHSLTLSNACSNASAGAKSS